MPAIEVLASTPAPAHSQEEGSITRSGAATQSHDPYISPIIALSGRPSGGSRQRVVRWAGSVSLLSYRLVPPHALYAWYVLVETGYRIPAAFTRSRTMKVA